MYVIDSCSKKLSQPPFGKVPSMSLGNPGWIEDFPTTNPGGAPGETPQNKVQGGDSPGRLLTCERHHFVSLSSCTQSAHPCPQK